MTSYAKIVLHWLSGDETRIGPFVEQCLRDQVKFIAVVGQDCAHIEDLIDECVVGNSADDRRFILTSSHPEESVQDAVEFAELLTGEYAGAVKIVDL